MAPAGTDRGGHPHRYLFSPHPVSGAAAKPGPGRTPLRYRDAGGPGRHRERHLRQPPAASTAATACRGCNNAKAGPCVTHLPGALAHGMQGRTNSMALRLEIDGAIGRALGVVHEREADSARRCNGRRSSPWAGIPSRPGGSPDEIRPMSTTPGAPEEYRDPWRPVTRWPWPVRHGRTAGRRWQQPHSVSRRSSGWCAAPTAGRPRTPSRSSGRCRTGRTAVRRPLYAHRFRERPR